MLQPGDKITIIEKVKRSTKKTECTVTAVYPRFITVDYGGYKGTIDNFDIQSGKIKIISEGKEMYKKTLPFTKSQLLEDCKVHGTNAEAAVKIAKKYGCTDKQVLNAISNYNIKNKTNARQEEEDMPGKQLPISKEQLLIECRALGTDKEAIKTIATTCGATEKQIEKAILNHGIRKKLEAEKAAPVSFGSDEPTLNYLANELRKDSEQVTKPIKVPDVFETHEPEQEEKTELVPAINMEVPAGRPEKFRLKPKWLLSQAIPGIEYSLMDQYLKIIHNGIAVIEIEWEDLGNFILDLQESKEIAG